MSSPRPLNSLVARRSYEAAFIRLARYHSWLSYSQRVCQLPLRKGGRNSDSCDNCARPSQGPGSFDGMTACAWWTINWQRQVGVPRDGIAPSEGALPAIPVQNEALRPL